MTFLEAAGAGESAPIWRWRGHGHPGQAHPSYWGQRLTVVREFARHLATLDPASEVPAQDLLPAHQPRIAPYIYTDDEIAALIAAAGRLTPPLRATASDADRAARGHRGTPGKALALDYDDVDLRHRTVLVRIGKQHKQREVPLHDSTVTALSEYVRQRDARSTNRLRRRSSSPPAAGGCPPRTQSDLHPADPSGRRTAAARAPGRGPMTCAMPSPCAPCSTGTPRATSTARCRCCPPSSRARRPGEHVLVSAGGPGVARGHQQQAGTVARGARRERARADGAGVLHRTSDHPAQRQPAPSPPTATPSGCYSASPKTRPANSRFSWTSTIWTRR